MLFRKVMALDASQVHRELTHTRAGVFNLKIAISPVKLPNNYI